jgi:hypothetical protein
LTDSETKRYNEVLNRASKHPKIPRPFLTLVLLVVCVVFPLAVYFLVLAQLNRRRHPVMVGGVWDFAGVLFALSGFLLLGGPFIMATFNQDWRDFWLRSPLRSSTGLSEHWWYLRLGLWACYFAAILIGSIFLLRGRSRITSIYNVDPDTFDQSLGRVLDNLHLKWNRTGQMVSIHGPISSDRHALRREAVRVTSQAIIEEGGMGVENGGLVAKSREIRSQESGVRDQESGIKGQDAAPLTTHHSPLTTLEVNPFPAMCHVTLQWSGDDRLVRQEIETELAKHLRGMEAPHNPAATWLMSLACILMCIVFFGLALIILFYVFVIFGSN